MTAIEKLLNVARAEVGYIEKSSKSQLDDKTANAGSGNYTKYARDLDAISGFYNGKKQGYAWCDVFTDWCFVTAFGVEDARKLLCQTGGRQLGAGCKYSMGYYKNDGKFYTEPQIGDQIFFYTADKTGIAHTGIVVGLERGRVQTIEGNTRVDPNIVENGGEVCEKDYSKTYARIAGYGRPDYSIIVEEKEEEIEAPKEEPQVQIKYTPSVKAWQKAAMADGFSFPVYGADGKWGKECEVVARKAIVKSTTNYSELTKIVQRVIGWDERLVTGKYDTLTRNGIKQYQREHCLTADGCVGINTWKSMLKINQGESNPCQKQTI